MPEYNQNHALLRYGGPAWGGAEEWSCGLRLKHLGGDGLEAMADEAVATIEEVAGIVSDYVTDADAGFSNGVQLEWVKLDVINAATGKYAYPDLPNTFFLDPPVAGTIPPYPPQVAYAVTMRGTYRRGPAARGRWYVPVGQAGTGADGRMNEATAQAFGDAAGTFLRALQEIDSGAGPDAWAPWLYGDGIGGPRDSVITAVDVGRVYDTQRRRRNTLIEEYVPSATYPY